MFEIKKLFEFYFRSNSVFLCIRENQYKISLNKFTLIDLTPPFQKTLPVVLVYEGTIFPVYCTIQENLLTAYFIIFY